MAESERSDPAIDHLIDDIAGDVRKRAAEAAAAGLAPEEFAEAVGVVVVGENFDCSGSRFDCSGSYRCRITDKCANDFRCGSYSE